MPTLFESLFAGSIANALRWGTDVSEMEHAGLMGLFRESFIESVITPLLASPYKVSTGIIVDCHGNQSNQADVIVWDDSIHPPLATARGAGIFTVESVVATIEIKSTVKAADLRQALLSNVKLAMMTYVDPKTQKPGRSTAPINILFGFASDAGTKLELTRIHEAWVEVQGQTGVSLPPHPSGKGFNVADPTVRDHLGRFGLSQDVQHYFQGLIIPTKGSLGYASWTLEDNIGSWQAFPPDLETHRGVRMVLAGVLNGLRGVSRARRHGVDAGTDATAGPNIGHYLVLK